jgi:hypothetical protein
MAFASLTFKSIRARPVVLKLKRPVVARIATITDWPLILIDLYAEESVVGRSYLEPYTAKAMRYRRAAQHGHQTEQCDATGGGVGQHPSSRGRPVSEHDSLTSAGYRVGLAALGRRICTGDSWRCPSGDTASESNLSQR